MSKVRTCIYTIALNEIKHVDRFMEHAREADLVLVCDTGSTDGTVERLRELGAVVYEIRQRPWRFDVPRNTALSLIPADIDFCFSVDLDEYLEDGWSDALDKVWQESGKSITRISYQYIWNWKENGDPGLTFFADKAHARHGYRWRSAVHENVVWEGETQEKFVSIPEIVLCQKADVTKSRTQYLDLLDIACKETPGDDRMSFFYARELMFSGKYAEALKEFKRHLTIPSATWGAERAASYRYMARCDAGNAEEYLSEAVKEAPTHREPYMDFARHYYARQNWEKCLLNAEAALNLTYRHIEYLTEEESWGYLPYDFAAISAFNLGFFDKALEYGIKAVEIAPEDTRLKANLQYYQSAVS